MTTITVLDDVFAKLKTTVPEVEALAERYAGKLALAADPVVLDVDEGIKMVRALWHAVQVAKGAQGAQAPPAAAVATLDADTAGGAGTEAAEAPAKPPIRQ
jgi:hypothetical protein